MMRRLARLVFAAVVALSASSAFAQTEYFMTMFGAQAQGINVARKSHTFATFVKTEGGQIVEEMTISWMPQPGFLGPDNSMPVAGIVPGRNYTLDETIRLGAGRRVLTWGPYAIAPSLYQSAARRVRYLNAGMTQYKMAALVRHDLRQPALAGQPGGAINCIMAVSDIGGFLETGTKYGFEASQTVLQFLSQYLPQGYSVRYDVAGKMRLADRVR